MVHHLKQYGVTQWETLQPQWIGITMSLSKWHLVAMLRVVSFVQMQQDLVGPFVAAISTPPFPLKDTGTKLTFDVDPYAMYSDSGDKCVFSYRGNGNVVWHQFYDIDGSDSHIRSGTFWHALAT
eukprot:426242_1